MGLIKFSGLVSGIWGKVNGSVFTSNRSGAIIKNKQTPINQRSTYQTPNRNMVNQLSKAWALLTDLQRREWNSLAIKITLTNHWGDTYHPSGFNTFCRLNLNLFLVGSPRIGNAPSSLSVIALSTCDVSPIILGWDSIPFTFSGETTDLNTCHLIYSSPDISPGIFYNKKNVKIIGAIPPGTANVYNAFSDFLSIYPMFKLGQKIFFKLRAVNINTGFDSLVGTWSQIVSSPVLPSGIGFMLIGSTFVIN